MGAQIIYCDGFEVVPPPPEMNDLILFGSDQSGGGGGGGDSNCGESTVTTEEDCTVFSGDSSTGWPETKLFSFYFVKQPVYDDPDVKSKINEADSEIYHCNKRRMNVYSAQKTQRAEVASLYAQMESLVAKSQGCKVVLEDKKKEFDSLVEGLRCSSSEHLCFSKEELDHLIYTAHRVMEHGSIGVEEENWLLKETEETIRSEDSLAQKEASIQRLKLLAVEMNEVKKEAEAITRNIQQLNDKIGKIQNKIMVLDAEMGYILEQRDKSFDKIKMLRIQRDKGNAVFFQSLAAMRKAKELAASGNVRDLELYSSSEVDKFMTRWNDDKDYRDDYVKRTSHSLGERELSRDGRTRDTEGEAQAVVVKTRKEGMAVHKSNKEDSSSNSSRDGDVITDKQRKEARKKKAMEFNKSSAEESDVIDSEFPVYENPKKKEEEEEEVDEVTLKERKREEQLEKARSAMERKRKLQEKAAAKAAIRAQKEAEKKLKANECEKKAKKRASASNSSALLQSQEAINELEKVSTIAVSGKEKQKSMFPKRSFRYKHRGRGTEALPKAILNRRKAHRYWVWGLSSAALALSLFLGFLLLR
ncbi:proton pump-interactor 2 isoform X2 [Raphanus sativus]|uniref:Proton pump-interactor 2 isoform X2 n=1 Tax=Raphanus sativus TaxID=3726 RepID=A0A6J0NPQ6_RAPSA|nr:proton pump-interactor 2 isoform X2 [Raphanus sativus]